MRNRNKKGQPTNTAQMSAVALSAQGYVLASALVESLGQESQEDMVALLDESIFHGDVYRDENGEVWLAPTNLVDIRRYLIIATTVGVSHCPQYLVGHLPSMDDVEDVEEEQYPKTSNGDDPYPLKLHVQIIGGNGELIHSWEKEIPRNVVD